MPGLNPLDSSFFYIGKTDSWGDNGRLLKVGKVRVTLDPAPPVSPFRQELSLIDATMKVRYGDGTTLDVWVDANRPVIHVRAANPMPVPASCVAKRLELRIQTTRTLSDSCSGPCRRRQDHRSQSDSGIKAQGC
jgi:hypothetical protein